MSRVVLITVALRLLAARYAELSNLHGFTPTMADLSEVFETDWVAVSEKGFRIVYVLEEIFEVDWVAASEKGFKNKKGYVSLQWKQNPHSKIHALLCKYY
jgi:hypothetical protein